MTGPRTILLVACAVVTFAAVSVSDGATPPRGFEKTFDYNRKAPLKATRKLQSEDEVSRIEKVTYRGHNGDLVPALLSRPKGVSGRVPCVFVGHAATGSKDEVFGEKAYNYAARGVAMFAIDARYHGERAGIGFEKALGSLDTYYKLYRSTVIDMRRGLDYLEQRKICRPDRLGYEGRSMGGFMGSMLMGADKRIKAAAFWVSGADWRKYLAKTATALNGPLSGKKLDAAVKKLKPLDPLFWIPRVKGRPVFMAAGKLDEAVPIASARALHNAAKQPKEILIYNGGHDIEEPHGTRVAKATAKFFKRYLRFK